MGLLASGGIGKYTLALCTTKGRPTTNLKTINTQNYQKIELYGSLTTKELKKKHSSRPVGRLEIGSQGGEEWQQAGKWRTGQGSSWQTE